MCVYVMCVYVVCVYVTRLRNVRLRNVRLRHMREGPVRKKTQHWKATFTYGELRMRKRAVKHVLIYCEM